ncbi:MAG: Gx transporter family protein [Butyrivibrio sp.]|nr:Gx transporter family protein [Butyrivibrio sp.]
MKKSFYISFMGLLIGVALILSYIESLIPFFYGIPGMKLGLANMAIVMALFTLGNKEAVIVNVIRIVLAGLMFGNLAGIIFSIAGAAVSFLFMLISKKSGLFSIKGVSIVGGVTHNAAQLVIAAFVVKTSGIIYYMPFLIVAGALTGLLNGIIASGVEPVFRKIYRSNYSKGEL